MFLGWAQLWSVSPPHNCCLLESLQNTVLPIKGPSQTWFVEIWMFWMARAKRQSTTELSTNYKAVNYWASLNKLDIHGIVVCNIFPVIPQPVRQKGFSVLFTNYFCRWIGKLFFEAWCRTPRSLSGFFSFFPRPCLNSAITVIFFQTFYDNFNTSHWILIISHCRGGY